MRPGQIGVGFPRSWNIIPDEKRLMVRAVSAGRPEPSTSFSLAAISGPPAGYAYQTGTASYQTIWKRRRVSAPPGFWRSGYPAGNQRADRRGGERNKSFGVLEVRSADPGEFGTRRTPSFLAGFCQPARASPSNASRPTPGFRTLEASGIADAGDEPPRQEQPDFGCRLLRVAGPQCAIPGRQGCVGRRQRSRGTIAQVHDHLWRGSQIGFVELNDFMTSYARN